MGFKCGIIGLPNVGKSTLFNAMTRNEVPAENYPFCTIEPNVGVVEVPDSNLPLLYEIVKPQRLVPTTIQFVDIAGLVKGANKGEGLGNKFLGHIRETDAIVHVVRCFEDDNITHVDGSVDPVRDCEIIETEICLSDLEIVEKRIINTERMLKTGDKKYKEELEVLKKLQEALAEGKRALEVLEEAELEILKEVPLITSKPLMYVANISEDSLGTEDNEYVKSLKEFAKEKGIKVITLCVSFEEELAQLEEEEREEFLKDFGLTSSGLDILIRAGYELLDLVTFYTTDGPEVKAWTVKKGTKAPQAAGKIHTDFERGFIRAEVINAKKLIEEGGFTAAREKGLISLEGKDYIVQDEDVIHFRFNV